MRYHPVKSGGRSHSTSGVIMILVCHMISQDRVIKGSYDPNGGSLSWYVNTLLRLVAIDIVVVEI